MYHLLGASMKKEKEWIVSASITVEASYIVPMILIIIFTMMELIFYLHDITVIPAIMEKQIQNYTGCIVHPYQEEEYFYDYASINKYGIVDLLSENKEQEMECQKHILQELSKSLMSLDIQNVEVSITNKKITVRATISGRMKFPLVSRYISFVEQGKIFTCAVKCIHMEDTARIAEQFLSGDRNGG